MRNRKKHYGFKLLVVLVAAFCAWVYFWDKPAPVHPFSADLDNDILQN